MLTAVITTILVQKQLNVRAKRTGLKQYVTVPLGFLDLGVNVSEIPHLHEKFKVVFLSVCRVVSK